MEDKYIIDNNVIWEIIKDQFEETGEIIDNMKVYRLKNPIPSNTNIENFKISSQIVPN